jgi:hypothetical protein
MLVIPKWQPSGFTNFKIVKRHPHWSTFCCSRFWKIKLNWSLNLFFLPCLQVELRFHALWWLLLPATIHTRVMQFYFPLWFPTLHGCFLFHWLSPPSNPNGQNYSPYKLNSPINLIYYCKLVGKPWHLSITHLDVAYVFFYC